MGAVAGKGAGEQSVAHELCRRLDDWLLVADRNFFSFADWCTAAGTGAQLLWRVEADLTLPALALLPDGSCSSVLVSPKIRGKARKAVLEAERILATAMAGITRNKHLNPERRHRTCPRVVKRARHNSYRVKRPGGHGTRRSGPATIKPASLHLPALAA